MNGNYSAKLNNKGFSYDVGAVQYNIFTSDGAPTVIEVHGNNEEVDVVFTAAPVPEPATWALLAVGLAGLGMAASSRRPRSLRWIEVNQGGRGQKAGV
jgi:hypothetical protein